MNELVGTLKAHEDALKAKGIMHAAIFGSTARGDAGPDSDVDILIDLDESKPMNVFDYMAVKEEIKAIVGGKVDVVTREGLKKTVRERVEQEAIDVF